MNSDDDDFLDRIHFIQHVDDFVSPPCVSHERFFLEENVMPVMHVEHRVFLERVFVVPRRQENAESMLSTGGAREWRHQLTDAAMSIFAKIWVDLQGRT